MASTRSAIWTSRESKMVPITSSASCGSSRMAAAAHRSSAVPASRNRTIMSVFADDLLILVADTDIEAIKQTLDIDMKLKWTDVIGSDWTRYLGEEWRSIEDGTVEVRVPPKYWRGLLEETGLTNARSAATPCDMSVKHNADSPCLNAYDNANFRRYVGKILYTAQ
eukprot:14458068-Heterocapsa_arctica.AAC.1